MRSFSGSSTATPETLNDLRARSRWFGLVPDKVAEQQLAWERRDAVTRMRHLGYTLDEIAKRWGTSSAMISYLLRHQASKSQSPIVKWLADESDILALAKLIRRTALKQLIDEIDGVDSVGIDCRHWSHQSSFVAEDGTEPVGMKMT